MSSTIVPPVRFDPKNPAVNFGGRPPVKEPEHVRDLSSTVTTEISLSCLSHCHNSPARLISCFWFCRMCVLRLACVCSSCRDPDCIRCLDSSLFWQARVWREMDGDSSIHSFLNALHLTEEEIDDTLQRLTDAGVRRLEQLLLLSTLRMRVRFWFLCMWVFFQ